MGSSAPLYLFDRDDIACLTEEDDHQATRALVNRSEFPTTQITDREVWRRFALLTWLLVTVLIWWLERRSHQSSGAGA